MKGCFVQLSWLESLLWLELDGLSVFPNCFSFNARLKRKITFFYRRIQLHCITKLIAEFYLDRCSRRNITGSKCADVTGEFGIDLFVNTILSRIAFESIAVVIYKHTSSGHGHTNG